jgi:hypothetical protein
VILNMRQDRGHEVAEPLAQADAEDQADLADGM